MVGKLDAEQAKLAPLGQELFHRLFDELVQVEAEVAYYEEKLLAIAEAHPECQRLLTIPGIGPLTATALIAAVSDVGVFQNGRQFAAWLGLVPKQYSTGGDALVGDQQAGGSLPAQTAHSRSPNDAALGANEDGPSQSVDSRVTGAAGMEPYRGGSGEQECADRMGLIERGRGLQGGRQLKQPPTARAGCPQGKIGIKK